MADLILSAVLTAVMASCVCAADDPPRAAVGDNTLSRTEKAQGFRLLFDGKTLDHWKCTGPNDGHWVVQEGAILCAGKPGPYLYTGERFGDFELKIDFMVDKGANSGIFFRWDKLEDPVQTGIEVQILDTADAKVPSKYDSGAIYDCVAPSVNAMKPALQWNSVLLRCRRNIITVAMNGKRIIQMDLDKWTQPGRNPDGTNNKFATAYKDMPREGYIGLQNYGNKVWFKNAKIRTLK